MNETIVERFVGIDVSKSTLDVCIEPAVETLHVAYDETGISQIVDRLKEASPTLIVMEATGDWKSVLRQSWRHLPKRFGRKLDRSRMRTLAR